MMSYDPLTVDSNFFKDDPADDSEKALSYVQANKKVDKSILTIDYEAKRLNELALLILVGF